MPDYLMFCRLIEDQTIIPNLIPVNQVLNTTHGNDLGKYKEAISGWKLLQKSILLCWHVDARIKNALM